MDPSFEGGTLATSGIGTCLLDVNRAHVDAVNASGLRLGLPSGSSRLHTPATAPEACPPDIGLIILLTKSFHTEAALRAVQHAVDAGACVLTLQNGLGNADRVARQVPRAQVFHGATLIPAGFVAPGHVRSPGQGWTVFKPLDDGSIPRARNISGMLEGADIRYSPTADVTIWEKAAFNCAMNATCGLSGGPVGVISRDEAGAERARGVTGEVIGLAGAHGTPADENAVWAHIEEALARHQQHKPSMLQDIEAGRETEIETLCGEVARQAREIGVEAPLNRALHTLVRMKQAALAAATTDIWHHPGRAHKRRARAITSNKGEHHDFSWKNKNTGIGAPDGRRQRVDRPGGGVRVQAAPFPWRQITRACSLAPNHPRMPRC